MLKSFVLKSTLLQPCFHFANLKAQVTYLDQLLDAIGDVEVAFLILVANIASLEVPIIRQSILRAFCIIQIALEDIRTLDPQLAGLAYRQLLILRAHILRRLVRQQHANRADSAMPPFPRLGVRGWRGLTKTVTLLDLEVLSLVQRVNDLPR